MIAFPSDRKITEGGLPEPGDFERFHPFIKGVFSQWHPTPFELEGVRYSCAEQYMMAAKASLFNDQDAFDSIMATSDPALQKRLGSQVIGFEEDIWQHWRLDIVFAANHGKFAQNSGALRQLRNTDPAMLVEANPRDWNWGNGLQLNDPGNHVPTQWRGTNFLGRILTLLRINLSESKLDPDQ